MEDTMPEYVGDISIRFPQRPEDVPNELEFNHSLMAQCEVDSLRSEIINLQDQRDLAMKVIKRLEEEREEWYRKAHANFKFTLDARDERDKARIDAQKSKSFKRVLKETNTNLKRKQDIAQEQIKELIYIAERAIDLAAIDFENDKFGVVSELRSDLEKIKEETK
jgi:hypothetical protein